MYDPNLIATRTRLDDLGREAARTRRQPARQRRVGPEMAYLATLVAITLVGFAASGLVASTGLVA